MKRLLVILLVTAFAVGFLLISNDMAFAAGKDKAKAEEKRVEAPATVKVPEGKVVCKFKDKDQMAEFEQLYIAKQATFGRMGVLQAYFAMEQNNLQQIDKQMEDKFKFKMDTDKMYDLNRDAMEIREVGTVPQQPTQQ